MTKDPKILLKHILESIERVKQYLVDADREKFLNTPELQDASERRLQIIGEAIVQLPDEFKENHPEIEWAKIAGLRNRIVHEYFDIDHLLVWNILKNSLPEFKESIERLL